jgi:small conductance mechanosensitive channel
MPNEALPIERLYPYLAPAVHAAVYLLGAGLLSYLTSRFFRGVHNYSSQLIRDRGGQEEIERQKQANTVASVARRLIVFLIWSLAILMAMRAFHFDIAPLLAGAGVAGIAIGFAAQNLLKDLLNGAFLLAEGYIRIQDTVTIQGISGTVEELSLRNTVLRGLDGAVHVFPNGVIQNFSNHTRQYSYAVFDIPVDFAEDPARAAALLTAAAAGTQADAAFHPAILEPLEMLGIDRFAEQGVYLKARIKTQPNQQWRIGREINRRYQQLARQAGVAIATAQRQVQVADRGPA